MTESDNNCGLGYTYDLLMQPDGSIKEVARGSRPRDIRTMTFEEALEKLKSIFNQSNDTKLLIDREIIKQILDYHADTDQFRKGLKF